MATSPPETADEPSKGVLVLVTGTGRSGTSTVAGSLHHLGLHVPGPYLGANKSNPKGFFESRWAVQFHKRITERARINDFDGRPNALELAQAAVTPRMRENLAGWLAEQASGGTQLVVKDPRSVWAQRLWRDAALEVGLRTGYLSMLRHPAEVIGSRTTYYASGAGQAQRRRYETFSLGRWLNSTLISERETRGHRRTFVSYTDLLENWRPVMSRVGDELELRFNADPADGSPHPVDDFIDPDLRRVRVTWADLEVPEDLRSLAQQVWDDLLVLRDHRGADEGVSRRLDAAAVSYARLFDDAAAISHDAMEEAVGEAHRRGLREGRRRDRRETGAEADATTRPAEVVDRAVRDVTARQLLQVVGGRAARRIRRR